MSKAEKVDIAVGTYLCLHKLRFFLRTIELVMNSALKGF